MPARKAALDPRSDFRWPMKENFSASRTCRPEQGLRQFVDSRSDEAKHAENFSAARREAHPAERARDLQIPNFKGNGAVGGFTFSRENASQQFLEHQLWDGNPVFRRTPPQDIVAMFLPPRNTVKRSAISKTSSRR